MTINENLAWELNDSIVCYMTIGQFVICFDCLKKWTPATKHQSNEKMLVFTEKKVYNFLFCFEL